MHEGIAAVSEGPYDFSEDVDKGHGRVEIRRVWATSDIAWCSTREQWPGLRTWAAVECERSIGQKTSVERRCFISSPSPHAATLARLVRDPWRIEHELHWELDVAFNEDPCRLRTANAADNLSRFRRVALSLLKQERTHRLGIQNKRLQACWDKAYLLKLLAT